LARQTRFSFLNLEKNNGAKRGSYFSSVPKDLVFDTGHDLPPQLVSEYIITSPVFPLRPGRSMSFF
ncbi:MAG: hypothetical protein AAF399_01775, partial [Bacteroidota bacterium]